MAKIDIYSFGKSRGQDARDIIECLEGAALARLEQELGRKMTVSEKDLFAEGFWNGVV